MSTVCRCLEIRDEKSNYLQTILFDEGVVLGFYPFQNHCWLPILTVVCVVVSIIICCKKKYARRRAINMMPMGAPIALAHHNNQYAPPGFNPYAPPGFNPYAPYSQPPPYDPPKANTQAPFTESAPPPYTAPSAPPEQTSRT